MALWPSGPARAADEVHWTITGPTSVTFDWRGAEAAISYGLTLSHGSQTVATAPSPAPFSSSGPFRQAPLTGLQENTEYHYAIGGGPDHTFRTPPPPGGSGFTVCAQGDIGDAVNYQGMGAVQDLIAAAAPAFTLMVGDLTYAHAHGGRFVDQHFNDVMVWSEDAAYMPAWGNAEWDGSGRCSASSGTACDLDTDCPGGETCLGPGDDLRNYKGRFDLPHPQTSPGSPALSCCGKDWSWFDYGNVRFIAYPEPWPGSLADWNTHAAVLMDEAQSDPGITFIVTYGHRPAYSSGHHSGESALKDLLDALGAGHSKYVLNLNGHSHNYERSFPQGGVVHVTVGTGGASLEQDGSCLYRICAQPSWSAFRAMHLGSFQMRVAATGIAGRFVCGPAGEGVNDVACAPGSVIDTFSIAAPAGDGFALSGPVDATLFTGPVPPQRFTWSPAAFSRFQVQFSSARDPFVVSARSKKKFVARTVYTPSARTWNKIRALGAGGRPVFWRVLGRLPGSPGTTVSGQVFSFSFGP